MSERPDAWVPCLWTPRLRAGGDTWPPAQARPPPPVTAGDLRGSPSCWGAGRPGWKAPPRTLEGGGGETRLFALLTPVLTSDGPLRCCSPRRRHRVGPSPSPRLPPGGPSLGDRRAGVQGVPRSDVGSRLSHCTRCRPPPPAPRGRSPGREEGSRRAGLARTAVPAVRSLATGRGLCAPLCLPSAFLTRGWGHVARREEVPPSGHAATAGP